MTRTLPLLLGAVAFASLAGMSSAEAGHGGAHFSGHVSGSFHAGGAHFSGGAHVNVGVHYSHGGYGGYGYRGYGYGGRYGVGGHIYVGGCWGCGWGYPYYGSYYYYPEYVPSYYGTSYYPIQAPASVAVVAPRPQLPRFGIGIAGGSVYTTDVDNTNQHQSDDLAFLARIRLTPGLILEGELGKTTYDQNSRVDRRLGASLIYEIGAYNHLAPYILVGAGAQQADVGGGDYQTTQDYGEVGVGLRYALTPHFHITADVRAGSRSSVSDSGTMPETGSVLRTVTPPASNSNEAEDYTRARLAAILYF